MTWKDCDSNLTAVGARTPMHTAEVWLHTIDLIKVQASLDPSCSLLVHQRSSDTHLSGFQVTLIGVEHCSYKAVFCAARQRTGTDGVPLDSFWQTLCRFTPVSPTEASLQL